ncbi:MAG TPA: alpha-amylase family glycosyl hydrolase [Spirochaetia bacterium]|nr:alpha-amylase family glycosyl hydrolase [Spirochaetia bacterium]
MDDSTLDDVFYHIYPLGAFGAPRRNDGVSRPEPRLRRLADWIPAMERVGADALYLGPVFQSESHGYDTLDYLTVDRRLGDGGDLAEASRALAARGIGLYLDAVFNHVGRGHPFVRDVVEKGAASPYARWIAGYDPSGAGPGGLPFRYDGWKGHYDLVRLDTGLPEVREYLIGVALRWIDEYGVAGLRLDAADCLDRPFMAELSRRCGAARPGFRLIGEVVRGDEYEPILREGGLDAVTDYEAYKGLWSSYNDRNFHEIAWTLDRLFSEPSAGPAAPGTWSGAGLCRGRALYSFADNHDVDRVASLVRDPAGLYPLYALLFSMPGCPSVYYGSEYGVGGRKAGGDDGPLRPAIDPAALASAAPQPDLAAAIGRFSAARRRSPALRLGSYRRLSVGSLHLAFERRAGGDAVAVAVNASPEPVRLELPAGLSDGPIVDLLDDGYRSESLGGRLAVEVPPHWARWLRRA